MAGVPPIKSSQTGQFSANAATSIDCWLTARGISDPQGLHQREAVLHRVAVGDEVAGGIDHVVEPSCLVRLAVLVIGLFLQALDQARGSLPG